MITITPPMTATTHRSHPCSVILTTPINTNIIVSPLSRFTFNESNNHVPYSNLTEDWLQQSVKFSGGDAAAAAAAPPQAINPKLQQLYDVAMKMRLSNPVVQMHTTRDSFIIHGGETREEEDERREFYRGGGGGGCEVQIDQ